MLPLALLGILTMTLSAVDGVTSFDTASIDTTAIGGVASVSGSAGGYEAINPRGRRKTGATVVTSEDHLLRMGRRDKLAANAADLYRNMAIAGWMIRRHLDYVALFDFHSRCASSGHLVDRYGLEAMEQLDRDVERLMREDSTKTRCDIGGRFHREKLFRIAEMQRVINGDLGLLKLRSGHLQGIEGDLIRDPKGTEIKKHEAGTKTEWTGGVRKGAGGRARAFALHRRGKGGSGYKLERIVGARNLIHYGHFSRFATDQARGVSPVTAGLNHLRDCHEGFDYALGKLKVSQLFALAIFSESMNSTGEVGTDGETKDAEGKTTGKRYNVDFGLGPVHLELDEGDRAEFLESKTPSSETQLFLSLCIGVALKSLDIPYSFYDENHTNFFGSRAAWLHYDRAAIDKRDDQIQMRQEYEIWRRRQQLMSGRLVLPAGMHLGEIVTEWVPRGMPWWDPSKEIRGDKAAVMAGFDNPERIVKRTGNGDVYDNLVTTMRVLKFAQDKSEEILGDPYAFVPNYSAPRVLVTNQGGEEGEDDRE